MQRSEKKPPVAHDIYRAIFDSVNDAIILRDLGTRKIVDVNSKLCLEFPEFYFYPLSSQKLKQSTGSLR